MEEQIRSSGKSSGTPTISKPPEFAYHAVPTNMRALAAFRYHITQLWRRTLSRRSQKGAFTWQRMQKLIADWLPTARILHPWPNQRFDVKHPRWEPSA